MEYEELIPQNYASDDAGATIVEVTSEAAQVVSSASNVLVDREEMLWISGAVPQHIVVRIQQHPPIRYLGWHVWHDYLTNPKTVEIATGVVLNCLTPMMVCTALPGGGTQLWELPSPIPESHCFIRFRITTTFGAETTYMNRIFLFSEHPGQSFVSKAPISETGQNVHQAGSPLRMTNLLRDLDDEIKMLHPLRNVTPPRRQLLYEGHHNATSSLPSQELPLPPEVHSPNALPLPRESPSRVKMSSKRRSEEVYSQQTGATEKRLHNLEAAMLQMVRHMDTQSKDIQSLRHLMEGGGLTQSLLLPQQHGEQHSSYNRSTSATSANPFPADSLRNYVEEVLAPKLSKHQKRMEERVMQRLDEHVDALTRQVESAVDEHVRRYLHDIAMDVEHPYHHHFRHITPTHQHNTSTAVQGLSGKRKQVPSTHFGAKGIRR